MPLLLPEALALRRCALVGGAFGSRLLLAVASAGTFRARVDGVLSMCAVACLQLTKQEMVEM